ncbi:regulator of G-protein signaling protein-like [Pelobates fuscus]|uniref:regulator of G-protein signaling protein-like n=1 Tax=Pelobates fuscus TaxID=191477 RepID=UPI002FE4F7F4
MAVPASENQPSDDEASEASREDEQNAETPPASGTYCNSDSEDSAPATKRDIRNLLLEMRQVWKADLLITQTEMGTYRSGVQRWSQGTMATDRARRDTRPRPTGLETYQINNGTRIETQTEEHPPQRGAGGVEQVLQKALIKALDIYNKEDNKTDEYYIQDTTQNSIIFGQTPCFISGLQQWELCPALPSKLSPRCTGFIKWLKDHRLPFFYHSDLCLHYLLCQELLQNGREGQTFHQNETSSKGEELACFWLHAERILGIDENDETQKALYLSLIRVLKVTHLRAGSAVMESCSISSESVAQLKHWHPPGRPRDVLNSLQTEALEKLHKYWVPGFLSHCQVCLSRFPEGSILLEIRQQSTTVRDFSDPLPMSIKKQEKPPAIYSSEVNKRRQWHLLTFGIGTNYDSYLETHATCQLNLKESNCMNSSVNQKVGCPNVLVPTSTRTESSFIVQPLPKNMQDPCGVHKILLPHPQDTPITCQFLSSGLDLRNTELISDWLHWALSAEEYASAPFHAFLIKKGEHKGVRLVSLWKELRVILWALLRKDSMVLCRVLSHQLCQNYLQEEKDKFSKTSSKTDSCPSQLIARRLRQLLPFQDALPWVLQAQTQVCQSLCSLYKQFLDEEDRIFLQFVSSKFLEVNPDRSVNSHTGEICINRIQRIKTALALAQACAHGEEIEPLDSEAWNILVTEDLSQGGSLKPPPQPEIILKLDFSKMTFEELVLWNPKLAIEMMSKQFHSLNLYKSSTEFQGKRQSRDIKPKKASIMLRKPSYRPRTLLEVLHDPVHLPYFRHFMLLHQALGPLEFWLMVDDLTSLKDPKAQRAQINLIKRSFFQSKNNPGLEDIRICFQISLR